MVTLNAQIIKSGSKKEYAVIPYDEFLRVQEERQSYEDLRVPRKAKEDEKNAPAVGDEIKKGMKGPTTRSRRGRK